MGSGKRRRRIDPEWLARMERERRQDVAVLERAMERLRAQSERERARQVKRRERLRRWSLGLLGRERAAS